MEYKDYYKVLGVDRNADEDTIKKAFRKLAKQYHPDAHPNDKKAEQRFKEINEAYEVLKDPEKRKKYDAFGQNMHFSGGANFDPSQFGWQRTRTSGFGGGGFSDFFEMIFGEQGVNIEDLFSGGGSVHRTYGGSNFGGGHFADTGRRVQGQDVETQFEVPLSMAMAGGEEIISLTYPDGNSKRIRLHVPKGIMPGEAIRLKGQGINGGDLVVRLRFKEQRDLRLDGRDLIMRLPVAPWEAALNEKIRVHTPNGKTVDIKLKPGLTDGKRLRIAGKGYTDRKGQTGDLFIEANVVVPSGPSEREKKLYVELKKAGKPPRRDG